MITRSTYNQIMTTLSNVATDLGYGLVGGVTAGTSVSGAVGLLLDASQDSEHHLQSDDRTLVDGCMFVEGFIMGFFAGVAYSVSRRHRALHTLPVTLDDEVVHRRLP